MNVSLLQRAIQVPVPHENVPRSRGAKEGFPLVYVLQTANVAGESKLRLKQGIERCLRL